MPASRSRLPYTPFSKKTLSYRLSSDTLSDGLIVMRDRLLAIPDHLLTLTQDQLQILRQEIQEALEACSKSDLWDDVG